MSKNFQKISQGINLLGQTSDPVDFADGDIYYNSSTGKFRQKAGGVVTDVGSVSIGDTLGGSPTVGSVLFVGAAGVLAQDNANFFWNDTTNRLGIGTDTPSSKLTLAAPQLTQFFDLYDTTSLQSKYSVSYDGSAVNHIYNSAVAQFYGATYFAFYNPVSMGASLNLGKGSQTDTLIMGNVDYATVGIPLTNQNILMNTFAWNGVDGFTTESQMRMRMTQLSNTTDDARLDFTTTFSETPRISLLSDGKVGIGTTTPGSKFEVSGGVKITTSGGDPVTITGSEYFEWLGEQGFYVTPTSNTATGAFMSLSTANTGIVLDIFKDGGNGQGLRIQGVTTLPAAEFRQSGTGPALQLKATGTGSSISLGGSTSGFLDLYVPAVVTSHSLTLPAAQGGAGETLTNDGSGNLYWAAGGSGSLQDAFDVLNTLDTSASLLDITSSSITDPTVRIEVTGAASGALLIDMAAGTNYGISINHSDPSGSAQGIAVSIESQSTGILVEQSGTGPGAEIRNQSGTTGNVIQAYLQGGGNGFVLDAQTDGTGDAISVVHNGTAGSAIIIDVTDSGNASNVIDIANAGQGSGINISQDGTGGYGINISMNDATNGSAAINIYMGAAGHAFIAQSVDPLFPVLSLQHTDGAGTLFRLIDSSGNNRIDIGVPSPLTDYTLILPDDQGGSGEVLTNDGSGNLYWSASSGGGWTTSVKTTTYTAVANDEIFANSSGGAFTIDLPATPSAGDRVRFVDYSGNWASFNVTVGRNGSNINGGATDYTLNVNDAWAEFVYVDSTQGWKVLL